MAIDDIQAVVHDLGPEGVGFSVLEELIPDGIVDQAYTNLDDSLPWYEQHNSFRNRRGVMVHQNFEVFGHKLSRGSQEMLVHLPFIQALGHVVTTEVVEPLGEHFPSLQSWEADECVAQKYKDQEGYLTWHKDLERHPGIIVIANILGIGKLSARRHEHSKIHQTDLYPGDILLLRAPGLYPAKLDVRLEHAVDTVHGPNGRISVTYRANLLPDEPIEDFHYHNWQPVQPVKS